MPLFILTLLFGIVSGCLLAVLVGFIGRRRRIGFGWAFIISLILTPLVGLIVTLLADPLPESERSRWGCIGTLIAILGLLCLAGFILLLLAGATVLAL